MNGLGEAVYAEAKSWGCCVVPRARVTATVVGAGREQLDMIK